VGKCALLAVLFSLSALSCGGSALRIAGAPSASTYLENFEGGATSAALGHMRLRPEVCAKADLRPVSRPLDEAELVAFAKSQGFDTKLTRARNDLAFVDLLNAGTKDPVRLRVAILDSQGAAARELHEALLQHGEGAWGVQRENLAVLAPAGPLDDVITMAAKTGLACWGVLMVAGHDDTFVVPGGYTEL
jgi:hypothetical protein